jgi:hypothetical protein
MTDQTVVDLAEPLGTVRTYEDFHRIIRARVESLDISRETVGEIGGLTPRYANKLLSPQPTKGIGRMAFGVLLGSLGLKLLVVEDAEALARVRSRLVKRGPMPAPGTVHWRQRKAAEAAAMPKPVQQSGRAILRNRLRVLGRKGGLRSGPARMAKLTPEQRSGIARVAARARWEKP